MKELMERSRISEMHKIIGFQLMLWATYTLPFAQPWRLSLVPSSNSISISRQPYQRSLSASIIFLSVSVSLSLSQQFRDFISFPCLVSLPKTSPKLQIILQNRYSLKIFSKNLQSNCPIQNYWRVLHCSPGVESHKFFSDTQGSP